LVEGGPGKFRYLCAPADDVRREAIAITTRNRAG
jgi:hypothetical protein